MKKYFLLLCLAVICAMNIFAQSATDSKPVDCGGNVQLTATPISGYHFVKWTKGTDEFTDNPLTITNVRAAVEYIAHFALNDLDFGDDVVIDNPNPNAGDVITLTASPSDECYQFKEWSDHNTDNPRTITYDGTAPFKAVYELKQYDVSAGTSTGDATQGSVSVTIVP